VDASSIKQQAAALEQQGKAAEAAELYRRVLEQLEGTPGIKREIPLYAKAGDALLKAGDSSGAVEMYERAAEHYAEHGSAKSILVLCLRVLRADRKQTDVFIRFARRLFDHGHFEASRTVLVDYATRAKLAKTLERLENWEGLPDDEMEKQLELLFSKAGKAKKSPEEPPPPVEPAPQEATEPEEPAVSEDVPPPVEEPIVSEDVTPPVDEPVVSEEVTPPAEEPTVEVEEPVEETVPEATVLEESPSDSGLPLIDTGVKVDVPRASPPPAFSEPSRSRDVLMSQPKEERKKKRPAWFIPAAVAAIVVVVGGGLVALNIIPLGGGSDSSGGEGDVPPVSAVPAAAESTVAAMPDSADTTGAIADSSALLAGVEDSTMDSLGVPIAAADSLGVDSLARDTSEVPPPTPQDTAVQPAEDTVPALPPPPVAVADSGVLEPVSRLPTGVTVEGPILAVEGLRIESVDGLAAGYRVVQRLDSGERLELTVTSMDRAQVAGAGALRVTTLPGDTAMGTVRFGDNLISARALVAADVLEGLLRQIGEVR
jgi:hypothetical protein